MEEQKFVKSVKFENGCLIIVNEDGKTISLDFTTIASARALTTAIEAIKELNTKLEDTRKDIKELETPENSGVIHKSGNELVSGMKSVRRLKFADFTDIDFKGITVCYGKGTHKEDYIKLYGESGQSTILVQRDPIEPLEVATKQYVDRLEDEIQDLRRLVEELRENK